jgi:ubiquinone/menaquinone biosynthesis C-methylase UbiE
MLPMPSNPQQVGRGFDRLAPIYDIAVKLCFGNHISQLQRRLLMALPKSQKVLIIGGGSGEILKRLYQIQLVEQVHYVELSEIMCLKAASKLNDRERARTFFSTSLDPNQEAFDLIILPFVLDCYSEQEILHMLDRYRSILKTNGSVAFIDFNMEPGTAYEPSLLKQYFISALYIFFRITTGIPAKSLAPFQRLFHTAGYIRTYETYDMNGWLQALLYQSAASKDSAAYSPIAPSNTQT